MRNREYSCFHILFLLLLFFPLHSIDPREKISRLESQLKIIGAGEDISILLKLVETCKKYEPLKSIQYGQEAIKKAEKENDWRSKGTAMIHMAYAYRRLLKEGEARETIGRAINLFEKNGHQKGIMEARLQSAIIYQLDGWYDTALKDAFNALSMALKLKDQSGASYCHYEIGIIYFNLENLEEAMAHYKSARDLAKQAGNLHNQALVLNNMGLLFSKQGDNKEALKYFLDSYSLFQKMGNHEWMNYLSLNLGRSHMELGHMNEAMDFSQVALEKSKESGDRVSEFKAEFQIGLIHFRKREFESAVSSIKRAIVMARELHRKQDLERFYHIYSGILSDMGDNRGALRILRLYMETKGEIINEKSTRRIAELQEEFKADKRKADIENLRKENEIERMRGNIFVLSSILLILVLLILFRKFRFFFQFWKKHSYAGQFRLLDVIGQGGMGIVYRACSIRDKNFFAAVKVLRDDLFESEESRKRFKNEAAIVDKLEHPRIIKIFERGEHKGNPYIAMELLDGETLDMFLKRTGPMKFSQCRHVMGQIAETLDFVHQKGVIHRDLKPSNILMLKGSDQPFNIKLLDFGLAKTNIQSRYTRTGELLGTLVYMSPEQLQSKPLTVASDIYSLGVILFEMVAGASPFKIDNEAELIRQKFSRNPPDPRLFRENIPEVLCHLILSMMSKNPRKRPESPHILNELLR